MDLSSSRYNTFSQEQHQQDIELRPSVDIFKRQKCSALFTHKVQLITHHLITFLLEYSFAEYYADTDGKDPA